MTDARSQYRLAELHIGYMNIISDGGVHIACAQVLSVGGTAYRMHQLNMGQVNIGLANAKSVGVTDRCCFISAIGFLHAIP